MVRNCILNSYIVRLLMHNLIETMWAINVDTDFQKRRGFYCFKTKISEKTAIQQLLIRDNKLIILCVLCYFKT